MTPQKQRALIIGLIAIGMLIVGFFGLRTARAFREFRGHRPPPPFAPADAQNVETDVELIRDWMTIPYISRMYHVPPNSLFDSISLSRRGNDEKSLKQLNEEYFPGEDGIVMEKVKAAVLANQSPMTPTLPSVPAIPSAP